MRAFGVHAWRALLDAGPSSTKRCFHATPGLFSYIGRRPIYFDPEKVAITVQTPPPKLPRFPAENFTDRREKIWVVARGPYAQHAIKVAPCVRITQPEPGTLAVKIEYSENNDQRAHWGTVRQELNNLIVGVTKGWEANLKLVGVGYRAAVETKPPGKWGGHPVEQAGLLREQEGDNGGAAEPAAKHIQVLNLRLGFSHPVLIEVPDGIVADCPDVEKIRLRGPDLRRLNHFAGEIRKWRKPEPYNQKGIFVNGETIEKRKRAGSYV